MADSNGGVKVTFEKSTVTIVVPREKKPTASKSGKSKVLASSRGIKYVEAKIDGKTVEVGVGVNVFEPTE